MILDNTVKESSCSPQTGLELLKYLRDDGYDGSIYLHTGDVNLCTNHSTHELAAYDAQLLRKPANYPPTLQEILELHE